MMKTSRSAMEMCFYCSEAGGQAQFLSCKNKVIILTVLCLFELLLLSVVAAGGVLRSSTKQYANERKKQPLFLSTEL